MRAFILALAFSCTAALAAEKKSPLAFYVASKEKIEGGRFIDTKEFPTTKPDLGIAELNKVTLTKRPGDRPTILITLKKEQADQLADFDRQER